MRTFNFPIITKVKINDFSLYRKKQVIEIDMDKSVFCLAGANGLGKSTFITILNYAITGIVRNPQRKFSVYNSIPKFYSSNKTFSLKYFEGRIDEDAREISDVEIHFKLGEYNYTLTRGFFDIEELRSFTRQKQEVRDIVNSGEGLTGKEMNELFMSLFINDSGLSDFSQFAFIQHFVLTFDETHQLLFWDKETMERVLYLFFGVDPKDANLADDLRKKVKKYTSDSGNLQWDITQATRELENLIKMASSESNDEYEDISEAIVEEYKLLTTDIQQLEEELEKNKHELNQVQLEISDYTLNISSLKREYEEVFKKTIEPEEAIESNPKVIELLKRLQVAIRKGSKLDQIIDSLINHIKNELNSSKKNDEDIKALFESLELLDKNINKLENNLENIYNKNSRVRKETAGIIISITHKKERVIEIEKENENFLKGLSNKEGNDITSLVDRFKKQIENLTKKKDEVVKQKDHTREKLKKLEKDLKVFYQNAEKIFLPKFIEYAQSFIGIELNIRLQSYAKGITLDLEVNDTHRKELYQLSESQRYFLDIALRMALIEYATNKSSLMIDTPEGSLDIAYENKAGKMFADFSKRNHQLIMTANINSSELLKEIAANCKNSGMKLERMIYWTTLSQVQIELESKIEGAYNEIETILNS
jgi:DNA repair exonuclease SbcCD ATPase subunit